MLQLQQSTTCPVCLEGAHTDTDEYQENWNQWHAHLLELEAHSEAWLSWQHKEPVITHKVDERDASHWLCRACVYKHNPVDGKFSIEKCPVCRFVLNIPGRNAENLVNLTAYARTVVSDEEDEIELEDDDESDEDFDVNIHVRGYEVNFVHPICSHCLLTEEVSKQNIARAVGEDIANTGVLMLYTRGDLYTPCGDERRNWAIQLLVHAASVLEDLNSVYEYSLGVDYIRPPNTEYLSLFDSAVHVGRHILALPDYFTDGRYVTPLHEFSPNGRYAPQIQEFRNKLGSIPDGQRSTERREEVYASASLFFLQTILPDMLAVDYQAASMYNNRALRQLNARQNMDPPALSTRQYVEEFFLTMDNNLQRYNTSVYDERVTKSVIGTTQGTVQIIQGPRPWVVMQAIHIHDQSYIKLSSNPARRRFWYNGIRIAYVGLSLSRYRNISLPEFSERFVAFYELLVSQNYTVDSTFSISSLWITSVALLEAAAIETESLTTQALIPLSDDMTRRNELIFEAMLHIQNGN